MLLESEFCHLKKKKVLNGTFNETLKKNPLNRQAVTDTEMTEM